MDAAAITGVFIRLATLEGDVFFIHGNNSERQLVLHKSECERNSSSSVALWNGHSVAIHFIGDLFSMTPKIHF